MGLALRCTRRLGQMDNFSCNDATINNRELRPLDGIRGITDDFGCFRTRSVLGIIGVFFTGSISCIAQICFAQAPDNHGWNKIDRYCLTLMAWALGAYCSFGFHYFRVFPDLTSIASREKKKKRKTKNRRQTIGGTKSSTT